MTSIFTICKSAYLLSKNKEYYIDQCDSNGFPKMLKTNGVATASKIEFIDFGVQQENFDATLADGSSWRDPEHDKSFWNFPNAQREDGECLLGLEFESHWSGSHCDGQAE